MDATTAILLTVISAATPLLLAALGELVAERAGVLNLGVEGMMLGGAVLAFAVAFTSGSPYLGIVAGAAAGAALALLFAILALSLLANQVATGLALTIFGIGLSSLVGAEFVGTPIDGLEALPIPGLSDLPVIGALLFNHDLIVYVSFLLVPTIGLFLTRTRAGMILRACGESAANAHALGHPVVLVRYLATLFGGACAGLAGAYISLAYTPMWAEEMTAGRGWIALALVVFASWQPCRVLVGAYLFGGITILQLHAQGAGLIEVPSQILSMLPYLATIVVLVVIAATSAAGKLAVPADLTRPFRATS